MIAKGEFNVQGGIHDTPCASFSSCMTSSFLLLAFLVPLCTWKVPPKSRVGLGAWGCALPGSSSSLLLPSSIWLWSSQWPQPFSFSSSLQPRFASSFAWPHNEDVITKRSRDPQKRRLAWLVRLGSGKVQVARKSRHQLRVSPESLASSSSSWMSVCFAFCIRSSWIMQIAVVPENYVRGSKEGRWKHGILKLHKLAQCLPDFGQDLLFQELWNFWLAHVCSLYPAARKSCIWPSWKPMWQPWLSLASRVWVLIAATLVALLEDDGSWCGCVVQSSVASTLNRRLIQTSPVSIPVSSKGSCGVWWELATSDARSGNLAWPGAWAVGKLILVSLAPVNRSFVVMVSLLGQGPLQRLPMKGCNEWRPGHCLCRLCSRQSAFLWL